MSIVLTSVLLNGSSTLLLTSLQAPDLDMSELPGNIPCTTDIFAAAARVVNLTWHCVHAICSRYVELVLATANRSTVSSVAVDETSYRRGHEYLTLVADMQARRVVFVTTGKDAITLERFAAYLRT